MLYVFHGTDIGGSAKKAHALIDSLRAKKPDAAFEHLSGDDWNASVIESHLGGQGLFSNKYIIFLDRLTENTEAREKLPEFAVAMNESANIFIVLEGKLNAELKKAFEKSAEKMVTSDEKPAAAGFKKKDFNIFALGDAVGSRDRMKAWVLYRQAVDNGQESESILGTLFWQVKSIALAASHSSAGAAGMSPFVYGNCRKFAAKYSGEELRGLMSRLISLYHDGHRGLVDLESGIERLLLSC